MVEPLAVGMHGAKKAQITPGDTAVVIGAGTIGIMTALSALAGGCSSVIMSDVEDEKLRLASSLGPIETVNVAGDDGDVLQQRVNEKTGGWGADIVFEASGNAAAAAGSVSYACPGGTVVFIGMPGSPVALDLVAAQAKEIRFETIFRYANVYDRAIDLMQSGKIDVKPLINKIYPFEESVRAFEEVSRGDPKVIKAQIEL
jgi:D-xylulose reductase